MKPIARFVTTEETAQITRKGSRIILMYRKPRFLEELHAIREEMSRECDYDADLFAEMVRSGQRPRYGPSKNIRGVRSRAPGAPIENEREEKAPSGQPND